MVSSVIVGPRTLQQMKDYYPALDVIIFRDDDVQRGIIIFHLLQGPGADNDRTHHVVRQYPCGGELAQRYVALTYMVLRFLGDDKGFLTEFGLHDAFVLAAGPAAFGRGGTGPVLAGQHTAGDGAVWHYPHSVVFAGRKNFDFRSAVQQVVTGLACNGRRNIGLLAQADDFGNSPAPEV